MHLSLNIKFIRTLRVKEDLKMGEDVLYEEYNFLLTPVLKISEIFSQSKITEGFQFIMNPEDYNGSAQRWALIFKLIFGQ